MTKSKRMGRPPIASKLRRNTEIRARVTEDERSAVMAAALRAGQVEADFIRDAVFSRILELSSPHKK